MSRPVARIGDRTLGYCKIHNGTFGGTVITGSPDTNREGPPQARIGDIALSDCGHTGTIVTGSPSVFANGRSYARLGDMTSGIYVASIVSASSNVFTD